MKIIICIDTDNGMAFNNRRQSMDREVFKDIMSYTNGQVYMTQYSAKQFPASEQLNIISDYEMEEVIAQFNKEKQGGKGFYFVEAVHNDLEIKWAEELILYRWDKKYPSDSKLVLNKRKWQLKDMLEFKGYSHEKIIREVYVPYEEN